MEATILGVNRVLVFSLSIVILVSMRSYASADASESATVISGGDLPHAVRLAAADEDAFMRRINPPPRLDKEPRPPGESYIVTSSYWDEVLRGTREDRGPAAAEAMYFPNGGFVQARQGSRDVWLALDVRQQAILARYIRLARQGLLSETPGSFEVIRAAARTEPIGVMVGSRELTSDEAKRFWEVSQDVVLRPDSLRSAPQPPWPPPGSDSITWIVFTLPEGRAVELVYSVVTAVLVDRAATELYPVPPRWLAPVLGAAAVPGPDFEIGPAEVAQQTGRGSPAWWVLMVGGGVLALALAFWANAALRKPGG